jgi:predicted signal transduction protein with EAL and GGDEF domain
MVLLARVDAAERAGEIADRILEAVRRPYLLQGREVHVSASVGVAVYPADGADSATLMRSADLAMYAAKQAGRNAWQLHDAGMSARAGNVLELKTDLSRALERDEFFLHYQPQVDGRDDRLVAFEALIRWRSPQRGVVPPLQFIPVAEETGLIVPIGEWVLREVCRQVRAWDEAGLPPVRVAVNVSARQFVQSDLVERVRTIVTAAGVDPRRIEIEVTESIAMKNAEHAASALEALKALGFEVALDDFGTGHSSLAYLRQFPFDRLKMDRGFLRDATASDSDRAIIEAIVVLAHSLGLEVVAEGVETQEHIALLRAFGCDLLQGYGIARPMDADAATGLLVAAAGRAAA